MQHGIEFIDDDALPEGHDFVFVETPGGGGLIFYKESQISPESLEDSWAAYRALAGPDRTVPTTSARLHLVRPGEYDQPPMARASGA